MANQSNTIPKKIVYLHIGPPKTGTTAIQDFMVETAERLNTEGVLYPKAGRVPSGKTYWIRKFEEYVPDKGPKNAHHLLGWTIRKVAHGEEAESYWQQVLREMDESDCTHIVISSEEFSQCTPEEIHRIRTYLNAYEVRILIYIRSLFPIKLSTYTQDVKAGRYFKSFNSYIRSGKDDRQDYDRIINSWSAAFSKERLILKSFDQLLAQQSLIEDFCHTIGLDPARYEKQAGFIRSNRSPKPHLIRILRTINFAENILGKPKVLKSIFRKIRFVILDQQKYPLLNGTFDLLKPLLGHPLYSRSDQRELENQDPWKNYLPKEEAPKSSTFR